MNDDLTEQDVVSAGISGNKSQVQWWWYSQPALLILIEILSEGHRDHLSKI